MDIGLALTASAWPRLLAYVLMLLLVVLLLALKFDHRATRAFSLLLVFRAFGGLTQTFYEYADSVPATDYWYRVHAYSGLPTVLAALFFLSVYPKERGLIGRNRWGPYALAVFAVALELSYAFDHEFYTHYVVDAPGLVRVLEVGPLYLLEGLVTPVAAAAALLFAFDYARAVAGPLRTSLALVSLGFSLYVVYNVAWALAVYAASYTPLRAPFRFAAEPPASATDPVVLLSTIPAAAICGLLGGLLVRLHRNGTPPVRAVARRQLLVLTLPIASVILALAFRPLDATFSRHLHSTFYGFWRLWLPILVAWALVRYHLFDIRLQLRWTFKQGTVAAAFLAVFFALSEGAASFLQSRTNSALLGILGAAVLVFALAPLQRVAERAADAAVPAPKPATDLSPEERRAFYAESVQVAWEDGSLNRSDRSLLNHLRARLGLSLEEAGRIELEHSPGSRPIAG